MTARGWLAALALGLFAPPAWAAPKPGPGEAAKPAADADKPQAASPDEDAKPAKPPAPAPVVVKQDLSGHDLATTKRQNVFESDRFFADKSDTPDTEHGTLIQGSLTSTSFGYRETGGLLIPPASGLTNVPSASPYQRLFTELRLQTDLRHISGGRWDARIDVRGRLVNDPGIQTLGYTPVTNSTVQSGLLGDNELELKELWLVRNGKRSDVFVGRQFVPDLGGVRLDGVRIDYAKSETLTVLGFAGLYPIRGSRSITDDYKELKADPDPATGGRGSAGRFTGTGGLGAAYRTLNTYGSFGAVVMAPLAVSAETPRVYATSTGYWRLGSKLDFYHLLILDAVGSNAVNAGLTNLSLGLNWKPDQRLRGTLTYNRVDTETLNVQAQAFLEDPDPAYNVVQNEAYIQRIATDEARASLSAGLGPLQRFELTAAVTFRHRGEVSLTPPVAAPNISVLKAAQSLEVYGSVTDRRSVAGFRLGLDGYRSFGIGANTYQRTSTTAVRVSASHELGTRGEVELEGAYNRNEDDGAGTACIGDLLDCFGAARSTVLSGGGNLFVRLGRNWFGMTSVFVNHIAITHVDSMASAVDPPVLGLSGFLRLSYRF